MIAPDDPVALRPPEVWQAFLRASGSDCGCHGCAALELRAAELRRTARAERRRVRRARRKRKLARGWA